MDQDELEDEIFVKVFLNHFCLAAQLVTDTSLWRPWISQREAFCLLAVILATALWLLYSSHNSYGLFWSSSSLFLGMADTQQQSLDQAAVYAVRGRRATMEDRSVMTSICYESGNNVVQLYAVLDGHGGEFAADYVKQYIETSLVRKIQMLKVLSHKCKLSKGIRLRMFDKLSSQPMTKAILDYFGMSVADYREACPQADCSGFQGPVAFRVSANSARSQHEAAGQVNSSLVLTSRVKPIDESLPGEDHKGVHDLEGSMYDTMLSPYNDCSVKKSWRSGRQQAAPSGCASGQTSGGSGDTKKAILSYLTSSGDINYAELLRDEIAEVDRCLIKDSKELCQIGGTTLLLSVLDEGALWVANVGDSRGVLCNAKGEVIPLSYDHKPCQLKEKKRIEEAGGFVVMNGVWRVQGILATSRALGDYPLKEKKVVISEPDVLSFKLSDRKHTDVEFAILATDGLWDTHSNEEVVAHIKSRLRSKASEDSIIKGLAEEALEKGSLDNITILLINFQKS